MNVPSVPMFPVPMFPHVSYTAIAPNLTTKVTDEGFSYDIRGEMTDVYQSTPNSGGYYHSTASYYVNGALQSLSPGITGNQVTLPWNYAVDGEGRMYSSSNSSGAILTSTTYNSAGQVTAVTHSSGDNDAYQYDNNGRMKQYQFNVGTTPTVVSGILNWNPNGTLGSLAISDGFVPANSQNCNYTHDDLARVSSVNCTSGATNVWNQNFSYDAYGNVTKTVPTGGTGSSFMPGYNNSNRYTSLPGLSYDSNGKPLNDSFHTYTWDANWDNPSTVDSTTLTYDALGQMVEYRNGTTIRQVMYGPLGKEAVMNSQTEVTSLQPYPAGGVFVHRPGTQTNYWRHPDWLGSSRFASTEPGRGKFFDVAYAPFGEDYGDSGTKDLFFTGQEQDATTTLGGLYDFAARKYAPRQGRWISPDPAGSAAADPTNPQSWNRYAYVGNSPLSAVDPSRLEEIPFCTSEMSCGGGLGYSTDPSGVCPPSDPSCGDDNGWGPTLDIGIGFGSGGGNSGGGSGGNGGGASGGSGGGSSRGGGTGGKGGSSGGGAASGENLGIPTGWRLPRASLLDLLNPNPTPDCEFGVCTPIDSPFQSGAEVIGAGACLSNPLCATIAAATTVAVLGYYYGPHVIQFAKGGPSQNPLPSWVKDRPRPGETADAFASRVCKAQYPPDGAGCGKGAGSEFNKIKKWAQEWINKHAS